MKFGLLLLLLGLVLNIGSQSFPESKNAQRSKFSKSKFDPITALHEEIEEIRAIIYKDPETALDKLEKTLIKSIKLQDELGQGLTYLLIGHVNRSQSQNDLAISYYVKAKNIFEKEQSYEELKEVYLFLGDTYLKLDNKDKAIQAYIVLIEKLKLDKDLPRLYSYKVKLGRVYFLQKKYEIAKEELESAKEYYDNQRDKPNSIRVNSILADIALANDKEAAALGMYQNSIVQANTTSDFKLQSESYDKLGDYYFGNGVIDTAVRYKIKSILPDSLSQNLDYNWSTITTKNSGSPSVYREIGEMYYQQGMLDSSIFHLKQSLGESKKADDLIAELKAEQLLSLVYQKQGDYEKAIYHNDQHLFLLDKVSEERDSVLKEQESTVNSLTNKQQRILLLEKNKELSDKQMEVFEERDRRREEEFKTQKLMVWSMAALVFLMFGVYYFMYKANKQKKVANQLLALKSLRTQMNPHFIFNALNSVNAFISQNDERSANKYLSEFSKLMRSVMENSKYDFVSIDSEIDIIKRYLELEHFRFKDKFEYEFKVDEDLESSEISIPPMLIQPYIENAIWHGLRYLDSKGKLLITLKEEESVVICIVQDNGIGREKSKELKTKHQKEQKSTGMKNTSERLDILNDINGFNLKVEIHDLESDGSGTKVKIYIPKNTLI
jgi:two-component system LytT family sensor kinase